MGELTSSIRVLFSVVVPPHLTFSGAWTAALDLAETINGLHAGVTVDVAHIGNDPPRSGRDNVKVFGSKAHSLLGPMASWVPRKIKTVCLGSELGALAVTGGYDIVHIHNPMPALEMRRVAQAAANANILYVTSTHGFVEVLGDGGSYGVRYLPARLAWNAMIRKPVQDVIDRSERVFALSHADAEIVLATGYPVDRIVIAPNGAPTRKYCYSDQERIEICKGMGVSAEDANVPVCLFVGNHTQNKGIDVLLNAFADVQQPFRLVVAGQRRDHDHVNYAAYEAMSSVSRQFIFPGSVSSSQLAALYLSASLFVFPSRADTFPLVILEAMSHGLAIVASDVGGIPEQLGQTGLIVQSGDVAGFTAAITKLL
jgi:alpha-maltose-1-phosphate synthase